MTNHNYDVNNIDTIKSILIQIKDCYFENNRGLFHLLSSSIIFENCKFIIIIYYISIITKHKEYFYLFYFILFYIILIIIFPFFFFF